MSLEQPDTRLSPPENPRIRAILDAVPADATVLDVGCVQHEADTATNTDWLHKHLVDEAAEVLGVDVLPTEVASLAKQGYDVAVADAEALDLDRSFDVIVAGELIEHLANPGLFLEGAREHLRPGGRLVLTTPNAWSVGYLKRLAFGGEVHCNEEHTCWYDRRTLRQLLERHGFDAEVRFIRPQDTTPTPAPQLAWRAGSKRLGALSLLAIAEPRGKP